MGKMITTQEAAEKLRVNKDTIRRLIREKKLPAKRIKGAKKWLIDEDDLKNFLS